MKRLLPTLALAGLAFTQAGCALMGVVAIAAKGIEESTPKHVYADYPGLQGKSFAVLVSADRALQAEYPQLVLEITRRVNEMLIGDAENPGAGATGYVPTNDVVIFTARNPGWPIRLREQLAKDLGSPDRLIIIEVTEFRLREPGNQYLWDGMAGATLSVVETDGPAPDEATYQRSVRVKFPDDSARGPGDMSGALVASALVQRLSNRIAWLMFDHTEPPGITY